MSARDLAAAVRRDVHELAGAWDSQKGEIVARIDANLAALERQAAERDLRAAAGADTEPET